MWRARGRAPLQLGQHSQMEMDLPKRSDKMRPKQYKTTYFDDSDGLWPADQAYIDSQN
jgi:hypothetical protein